jgi:homoserine dehydrogenase
MMANVEGAMNAVLVRGDAVGQSLFYGKGAGQEPTASSVVADLVDVTRLLTADPEHRVPHLAFQPDAMADTPILGIEDTVTSFYLRVTVADQSGVLADLTRLLANAGISIEAMIQQPSADEVTAELIFLTHEALERNVNSAIQGIEALAFVKSAVTKLRMETLA